MKYIFIFFIFFWFLGCGYTIVNKYKLEEEKQLIKLEGYKKGVENTRFLLTK